MTYQHTFQTNTVLVIEPQIHTEKAQTFSLLHPVMLQYIETYFTLSSHLYVAATDANSMCLKSA